MRAVRVHPNNGVLSLDRFFAVFLPPEALYDGRSLDRDRDQCRVVLMKGGEELRRWPLLNEPFASVFTTLRPVGPPMDCVLEEAGEYTLNIQLDDSVLATLPFEVSKLSSGDPFDPVVRTYLDGPWSKLGRLELTELGGPSGHVVFSYFARGGTFNQTEESEKYDVQIHSEGLPIFTAGKHTVGTNGHDSVWREVNLSVAFRKGDGGGQIRTRDLLKKDGEYEVVVSKAGEIEALFQFTVNDGKLVPHPRQDFNHAPHQEYLCARLPATQQKSAKTLHWMNRIPAKEAKGLLGKPVTASVEPGRAMPAEWTWNPTSDPAREPAVHTTQIAARTDCGIAVGDEIIAFGTGSNKGVSYLRVGEGTEQTIPNGQDYSSTLFGVSGHKIVLTKGNQVVLFDTKTGATHAIPAESVHLSKTYAKFYGPWPLAIDGNLIATINDPNKVSDRRMIKVIDCSGDVPIITSLRNPEVSYKEFNSIGVEAATGRVAVGWQRGKALWHGAVAEDGVLNKVDLSAHDGFGDDSPLQVAGGRALYFDDAGSRRLRFVDLDSGKIQTIGSLGKAGRHFAASATELAYMTDTSYGSNYRFASGSFESGSVKVQEAANIGEDAPGNGNFGMGVSAALTQSGLCFLAGQGKSGVSSGMILQVRHDGGWAVVAGAEGNPIPAVDVVASPQLIAFKTGKARDTRVAYITLGAKTPSSQIPVVEPK